MMKPLVRRRFADVLGTGLRCGGLEAVPTWDEQDTDAWTYDWDEHVGGFPAAPPSGRTP